MPVMVSAFIPPWEKTKSWGPKHHQNMGEDLRHRGKDMSFTPSHKKWRARDWREKNNEGVTLYFGDSSVKWEFRYREYDLENTVFWGGKPLFTCPVSFSQNSSRRPVTWTRRTYKETPWVSFIYNGECLWNWICFGDSKHSISNYTGHRLCEFSFSSPSSRKYHHKLYPGSWP